MKELLFYEFLDYFEGNMRIAPLLTTAKTATLAVSRVGLEAAIAVDVSACHHDGIDEQLEADGALEALLAHYAGDLVVAHSLLEVCNY